MVFNYRSFPNGNLGINFFKFSKFTPKFEKVFYVEHSSEKSQNWNLTINYKSFPNLPTYEKLCYLVFKFPCFPTNSVLCCWIQIPVTTYLCPSLTFIYLFFVGAGGITHASVDLFSLCLTWSFKKSILKSSPFSLSLSLISNSYEFLAIAYLSNKWTSEASAKATSSQTEFDYSSPSSGSEENTAALILLSHFCTQKMMKRNTMINADEQNSTFYFCLFLMLVIICLVGWSLHSKMCSA